MSEQNQQQPEAQQLYDIEKFRTKPGIYLHLAFKPHKDTDGKDIPGPAEEDTFVTMNNDGLRMFMGKTLDDEVTKEEWHEAWQNFLNQNTTILLTNKNDPTRLEGLQNIRAGKYGTFQVAFEIQKKDKTSEHKEIRHFKVEGTTIPGKPDLLEIHWVDITDFVRAKEEADVIIKELRELIASLQGTVRSSLGLSNSVEIPENLFHPKIESKR